MDVRTCKCTSGRRGPLGPRGWPARHGPACKGVTTWSSSHFSQLAPRNGAPSGASFHFSFASGSPAKMASEDDETTPPFTPEQLSWIDRLVDARSTALARTATQPDSGPSGSGVTPSGAPATDLPAVPAGEFGGSGSSGVRASGHRAQVSGCMQSYRYRSSGSTWAHGRPASLEPAAGGTLRALGGHAFLGPRRASGGDTISCCEPMVLGSRGALVTP